MMPTSLAVTAHVVVMAGVLWVSTFAVRSLGLPQLGGLRWAFRAGYVGFAAYLFVSAAYVAGVVNDVVEYLYLGYLAQTLLAASALAVALHSLYQVARIRVNYLPLFLVAVVLIPVSVASALERGIVPAHRFLSYHLMVAGFAFYAIIGYHYGCLGRFSERLGIITAALFYSGGIVFAGLAALYLYVTGLYLSGGLDFSVYTTYLVVESVMLLVGAAAGVSGALRLRRVKPVETKA